MNSVEIEVYHYQSPVGGMILQADKLCLRQISFTEKLEVSGIEPGNKILLETIKQLNEYFRGERKHFQIALGLHYNSMFQRLVWTALREIPYGEMRSYKEVAISIGRPSVFRAVGNACAQNRYPIIVPCHRVINSKGKLGGFSAGMGIKLKLLELEGNNI